MLLHVNFVQRSEGDRSQRHQKTALDGSKLHTITQAPNAKKPTTLADGGLRPPLRVALEWTAGQAKARVPWSSMIKAIRRGLVSVVLGMLRCVQPLPLGLANSRMT